MKKNTIFLSHRRRRGSYIVYFQLNKLQAVRAPAGLRERDNMSLTHYITGSGTGLVAVGLHDVSAALAVKPDAVSDSLTESPRW